MTVPVRCAPARGRFVVLGPGQCGKTHDWEEAEREEGRRYLKMATPVGTGPIVQDVAPKGGFPKVSRLVSERTMRGDNSHLLPPLRHYSGNGLVDVLGCFGLCCFLIRECPGVSATKRKGYKSLDSSSSSAVNQTSWFVPRNSLGQGLYQRKVARMITGNNMPRLHQLQEIFTSARSICHFSSMPSMPSSRTCIHACSRTWTIW